MNLGGPGFAREVWSVDARRRQRTAMVLSLLTAGASAVLALGAMLLPDASVRWPLVILSVVIAALCLGAAALARFGYGTAAALSLIGLASAAAWATVLGLHRVGAAPFYIALGLVVALVTLSGRVLRWTLLAGVACELALVVVGGRVELQASTPGLVLFNAAVFTVLVAVIVSVHARLFARLLEEVASQRAKTADAHAELEHLRRMEALGRFAGSIAHDFNNLLAVMNTCTSNLDRSVPPSGPLRDEVEDLREAIDQARGLTSQLLAFARRDAVVPTRVETGPLLKRVGELSRRVLGDSVKVEVNTEPGVWPLWSGPSQIEQLIMNLAANARDAMPKGGTFTISDSNAPKSPTGDAVLLRVTDTGVGMAPETLARAFEPFFTTKPPGIGTGLGLATVFGVVKALGGELTAESTPGKGTSMSMWLPRAPE